MRKPPPTGAKSEPDLVADELVPHDGGPLEAGFDLEDVAIEGEVDVAGGEAGMGRLASVRLDGTVLAGVRLAGLRLLDVAAERVDASNGDWRGAVIRRASFASCRLTGLNLGEAELQDVTFRDCKLDYANLRYARLTHVTFEDCVLLDADCQASEIEATRFDGCRLVGTDLTKATLRTVDLRGSELAPTGGTAALAGAIVDSSQLIGLAPALAAEAGITVADD